MNTQDLIAILSLETKTDFVIYRILVSMDIWDSCRWNNTPETMGFETGDENTVFTPSQSFTGSPEQN